MSSNDAAGTQAYRNDDVATAVLVSVGSERLVGDTRCGRLRTRSRFRANGGFEVEANCPRNRPLARAPRKQNWSAHLSRANVCGGVAS